MSRSTMAHLITELRGMVDAGTADYTVGTVSYWTDDQLQTRLDANRTYVNFEAIRGLPNNGTAITYTIFPTERVWWEDTMVVQEVGGGTIGTANYTADLMTGVITFTANQGGSARYVTGYTYNLFRSASDIWNRKAAHYVTAVDWSTDNHSMKRSQLIQQARQMAMTYGDLAGQGMSVNMDRVDDGR